jgi:hypothetical protein
MKGLKNMEINILRLNGAANFAAERKETTVG